MRVEEPWDRMGWVDQQQMDREGLSSSPYQDIEIRLIHGSGFRQTCETELVVLETTMYYGMKRLCASNFILGALTVRTGQFVSIYALSTRA
jgi:hypothetical protein